MNSEEIYIRDRMGSRNPFRVPEGYFDSLVPELMDKLPDRPAKLAEAPAGQLQQDAGQGRTAVVFPLFSRLRPLLYVAACLLVAVLSITVFLRDHDSTIESLPLVAAQEQLQADDYFDEVADYAMVDNYEIYACLTND
jgi:hypothetical protein